RLAGVRTVEQVEPALERGSGADGPVLDDREKGEQAIRGPGPARPQERSVEIGPGLHWHGLDLLRRLEQGLAHGGLAGGGRTQAHLAAGGEQKGGEEQPEASHRSMRADQLTNGPIGRESHEWRAPPACCSVGSFASCCIRSSPPRIWAGWPVCWPTSV